MRNSERNLGSIFRRLDNNRQTHAFNQAGMIHSERNAIKRAGKAVRERQYGFDDSVRDERTLLERKEVSI